MALRPKEPAVLAAERKAKGTFRRSVVGTLFDWPGCPGPRGAQAGHPPQTTRHFRTQPSVLIKPLPRIEQPELPNAFEIKPHFDRNSSPPRCCAAWRRRIAGPLLLPFASQPAGGAACPLRSTAANSGSCLARLNLPAPAWWQASARGRPWRVDLPGRWQCPRPPPAEQCSTCGRYPSIGLSRGRCQEAPSAPRPRRARPHFSGPAGSSRCCLQALHDLSGLP